MTHSNLCTVGCKRAKGSCNEFGGLSTTGPMRHLQMDAFCHLLDFFAGTFKEALKASCFSPCSVFLALQPFLEEGEELSHLSLL